MTLHYRHSAQHLTPNFIDPAGQHQRHMFTPLEPSSTCTAVQTASGAVEAGPGENGRLRYRTDEQSFNPSAHTYTAYHKD